MFSDRLSRLMNLSKTSNGRLSKALRVDTSLVSRWRTGDRYPSKKSGYLHEIAKYFIIRAKSEYQETVVCQQIGLPIDAEYSRDFLIESLEKWLCGENATTRFVDGLLTTISSVKFESQFNTNFFIQSTNGAPVQCEYFQGISGMREGAIRLMKIVKQHSPCTLILFSDEKIDWLTADIGFAMQWKTELTAILKKGFRIKIIHNVSRNVEEMLAGISHWLPLYIVGGVEPYYYPKYKESIFRKSLFLAPGIAALSTESIADSDTMECFLYTDELRLDAYKRKMDVFIEQCKPLMQILTCSDESVSGGFYRLNSSNKPVIVKSPGLSSVTITPELMVKMLERCKMTPEVKNQFIHLHEKRYQLFKELIKKTTFTDIVHLHSVDEVKKGSVQVQLSFLSVEQTVYYSEDEYVAHLESVRCIAQENKNYSLRLFTPVNWKINLFSQKNTDFHLIKTEEPYFTIRCKQQNLVDSFYNYLEETNEQMILDKQQTEKILGGLIRDFYDSRLSLQG